MGLAIRFHAIATLQRALGSPADIHMQIKAGLSGHPLGRLKLLGQTANNLVWPYTDVDGPLDQRDHVLLDEALTWVVGYAAIIVGGELVSVCQPFKRRVAVYSIVLHCSIVGGFRSFHS